jgi:hypothetical protein
MKYMLLVLLLGCGEDVVHPFGSRVDLPIATGGRSVGASTGGSGTGGASTGGASTGGASTGGASTGGASTGGASTGGASAENFVTNGTWTGSMYVQPIGNPKVSVVPATIVATNAPGAIQCVQGTVVWYSVALWGWTIGPVATSGTGLAITMSAAVPAADVRVHIQDAAMNTWCAILPGAAAMIPWSAFTTTCGSPDQGVPYTVGVLITDVQITIRPTYRQPIHFDFCIQDLQQY